MSKQFVVTIGGHGIVQESPIGYTNWADREKPEHKIWRILADALRDESIKVHTLTVVPRDPR